MDRKYKIKLDYVTLQLEEKGYKVKLQEGKPIIYYDKYPIGYIDNSFNIIYTDELAIIGTKKGRYVHFDTSGAWNYCNVKALLEKYNYYSDTKCIAIPMKIFNKNYKEYFINKPIKELLYVHYLDCITSDKCYKYENRNDIDIMFFIEEDTQLVVQYGHDKKNNKYYEKYVDINDESTWIDAVLER